MSKDKSQESVSEKIGEVVGGLIFIVVVVWVGATLLSNPGGFTAWLRGLIPGARQHAAPFQGNPTDRALPEMFRTQAMDFLQKGAALQAATDQGTSPDDFKKNLISVKASYDLAKGLWPPEDNAALAQRDFDDAILAWDVAVQLMDRDNRDVYEGEPLWAAIAKVTNGGKGMSIRVDDFGGKKNGMRYVWNDKTCRGVILGLAFNHFQNGKQKVLNRLSQAE